MNRKSRVRCPTCSNEFSGAMEFCPVCVLRTGLASELETGESVSQDAVKPTSGHRTQSFEHYELIRGDDRHPIELGRGAMGVTYRAIDVARSRPRALKVVSERYLSDEWARIRFLCEARAAGGVRHPNGDAISRLGRQVRHQY